jgi:hypothetical protein
MGKLRYSFIILNLGSEWKWVVSFTLLPFYLSGNSARYPLYRRLGRPQSPSGRYGEEKFYYPIPRIEPRIIGRSDSSLIAMPTEQWNVKMWKAMVMAQFDALSRHSHGENEDNREEVSVRVVGVTTGIRTRQILTRGQKVKACGVLLSALVLLHSRSSHVDITDGKSWKASRRGCRRWYHIRIVLQKNQLITVYNKTGNIYLSSKMS